MFWFWDTGWWEERRREGESCAEPRAACAEGMVGVDGIGLSEQSTESTSINQYAKTVSIARGAVDAIYIPWYFA